MNTQLAQPDRKPRSDATLKNESDALQEEIFNESRSKSNLELSQWLAREKHIQVSASTVSRFLGWFRTCRQGHQNEGANEALQEMGKTPGQFFQDTIVERQDLTAWHNAERIALRRERLQLDREKFQRTHVEYIIDTCCDPVVRAAAENNDASYAQKVREVTRIMFGDGKPNAEPAEEPRGSKSEGRNRKAEGSGGDITENREESGGIVQNRGESKSGLGAPAPLPASVAASGWQGAGVFRSKEATLEAQPKETTSNIQQPTSNIQHPVGERPKGEGANIQHSTSEESSSSSSSFSSSKKQQTPNPSSGGNPVTRHSSPVTSQVLEAAGSLSYEAATQVVNDLMTKAMTAGTRGQSPGTWPRCGPT
jgi:hypothetical protein